MEDRLGLLQGFLEELNRYCEVSEETKRWYERMKESLSQEQESRRIGKEEELKKQEASYRSMQEKNAYDRSLLQEKSREKIREKQSLLEQSIRTNEQIRDQVLRCRDEIARPEYFQYAYRYREYGDFYPEITRLDDFRRVDLKQMVDEINYGSAGIWLNKLKALFKSEDMMIEYASFANLLGKARYLCEVENDALKEKARIEIHQLEKELEESEASFLDQGADLFQKQQKLLKEKGDLAVKLQTICDQEWKELQLSYHERQLSDYNNLKQCLQESYDTEHVRAAYEEMEEAQKNGRKLFCQDGIPMPVKLGQLWSLGKDLPENERVKQLLEQYYPFMISENGLSIPGIA